MATAPRPGRVEQIGPDELTITFTLDGQELVVYPNLLTGVDSRSIREQTGMSMNRLLELVAEDSDTDVVAALAWIARCQAGEAITLADVADGVTYKTPVTQMVVDRNGAPPDGGHPLP